jgi:hypothetical protein
MLVPEEARVHINTSVTAAYNFALSVQACVAGKSERMMCRLHGAYLLSTRELQQRQGPWFHFGCYQRHSSSTFELSPAVERELCQEGQLQLRQHGKKSQMTGLNM